MAEYPKRDGHFAHKVVRLLGRTCAAQEMGTDACFLVSIVAHTEDAKRYTAPVTFWNDQLQSILGFTWGKLDRARKRAVAAGWLHYEPGGKGKVGRYWATTPPRFEGVGDAAIDEDHPAILSTGEEQTEEESGPSSSPVKTETEGEPLFVSTGGEQSREENSLSSSLVEGQPGDKCGSFFPKPIPKKRKTPYSPPFKPPTLEEVSAYCQERAVGGHPPVDPQQWYDHYTANGWMVGRTKMKDWKAAIRTWERNDFRKGARDARADRPSGRHHQQTVGRRPEATV